MNKKKYLKSKEDQMKMLENEERAVMLLSVIITVLVFVGLIKLLT